LVALSACPGGDGSASHSDDKCYPLKVEIHRRTRERWPAGCHHCRTNILARMEPGKGRLRLIRGTLELSDGPLRTAAVLYLPKASAAPQQADPCVKSIGSSVPIAYLAVVIRKPYPRSVLRFPSTTRSPMLTVALGLLDARGADRRKRRPAARYADR
jgi:hypothetical protein